MGGKPRPVRDGDPYALGLGDFVLAYAYAKRWLTKDGSGLRRAPVGRGGRRATVRSRIRKGTAKAATNHGMQKLARLRGVDVAQLPRSGSRRLQRRLQGAMETVWDRRQLSASGDSLGHKPPLQVRWHDHVRQLVRTALSQEHYVGKRGNVGLFVRYPVTVPGACATQNVTRSGQTKPGANYHIAITANWYSDVYKRGLARVENRLVLVAKPIKPSNRDLADSADEVFEVTYIEKGHGYKLFLQDGVAARIGETWALVPYGTEGSTQREADEVERAYKTIQRRLRKAAFDQHRARKRAS